MKIEIDDLSRPAIHALLTEHLQSMYALSPPESVHALDLERLRRPEITYWTAWEGDLLLGCGALKEIGPTHGEVKSMRTPSALRRRGAGRAILAHIIEVARSRNYARSSLETGSQPAFKPAQKLYERSGFAVCGPFDKYLEDPNSVFVTLSLKRAAMAIFNIDSVNAGAARSLRVGAGTLYLLAPEAERSELDAIGTARPDRRTRPRRV